ncbi:MAG: hypothetical protein ACHQDD_11100 [Steroidobacterales bacterium]
MVARHQPLSALTLAFVAAVTATLTMAAIGFAGPAAADTPTSAAPATPADAAATPGAEPGHWQSHSYVLHAMTFTSTYSCDGLADTLKLLLRLARAGDDAKVDPLCSRSFGVPDKLAEAKMTFSTLQPGSPGPEVAAAPGAAAAARPVSAAPGPQGLAGVWRHVEISEHHPFDLQLGDCELVERFRDSVLPMFATRNVQSQITCVPHQESGSNFSLRFDVFAPVPAAKSP